MLFLQLYEFFKLCSRKLWLFLEFDCLKNYNGNGKVREIIFWKNFRYHYVNLLPPLPLPPSLLPPRPPHQPNTCQNDSACWHTRLSFTVLFKFIKTRKLLLLLLAIYVDSMMTWISDDSNQGKDLDWQLQISLAKGYKFVQQLKTMIHVAVLGKRSYPVIHTALVSKGRKCKTGSFLGNR